MPFAIVRVERKAEGLKQNPLTLESGDFDPTLFWVNDSCYDSSGLFHSILCDSSFEMYFTSQYFKVLNMKIHVPFIFEGYDS